jgi:hypothetical protein
MGQGCRESQRSYLGRPVVLLSAGSKPGWEVGLGRQESAEAIVLVREHQEGPNVEEDGNLGGSWDRRRRQKSSDEDTTGWAKAVKLLGFNQRAESSPALLEGTSKDVGAGIAVQPIPWRTAGCNKACPVV